MMTMPVSRTLHRLLRALAFAALLPWSAAAPAQATPKLDVPYVPTPWEVVDKMLEVAQVTGKDTLYDLGCGDGRIVVTAARKHGTRGTGVDINPQRIAEAQAGARAAGVEDKVRFMVGNLFETDISPATVVTLYLLPDINLRLRPRLWQQLRVGARVVSHDFDMGEDWPPQRIEKIGNKTVYYWTITEAEKARATR
jgi:SAM-dependent methyltransferase